MTNKSKIFVKRNKLLKNANYYYMNIRQNRMKKFTHQSESPDRPTAITSQLAPLHKANKSQIVQPMSIKLPRKSYDSSKLKSKTNDSSYCNFGTVKDRHETSNDLTDYCITFDTEKDQKRKRDISEYFGQKRKFV